MKLERVGETYNTYQNYVVTIIEYFTNSNCTVKFNDKRGTILYSIQMAQIKKGNIKNPYHPSVCGIGYRGIGKYKVRGNNSILHYYKSWVELLKRCYNLKKLERRPRYKTCSVDKRWHNFQNFAAWFEKNYVEGFHLDKDILVKGNKIYSPETCCFVPQEVNTLFTKSNSIRGDYPIGVQYNKDYKKYCASIDKKYYNTPEEAFQAYKTAKEAYIKEVADKWRGQITEEVYQAMYNYQVEITD